MKRDKIKKTVRKTKDVVIPNKGDGTILLSGIFEEQANVSKQLQSDKSKDSKSTAEDDSDKESSSSSKTSESDTISERDNSVFDDSKAQVNDDENENAYLGDEWQWNQWEPHNIDDDIEGPNKGDRYEGPHGLRKNISKRFCTVLQCLFETTAMDRGFFIRLCGESNKYAKNIMRERNTTLFLGYKWTNIIVEEMVHFFGILLRISLEPRKMGGYTSYFQESHSITLASGYTCNLQGYQSWAKNIMNLVRFKQIRSAFRLESHRYDINDKCYQLR